ncbi:MAG: chorismate synthase, partial [Brevefilum sp.]
MTTLRFLTAGESHGPALLSILEGMPAGLSLSEEIINKDLARRQRGFGSGDRMKIEHDKCELLCGVMAGKTTGAPIGMMIKNKDHANWKNKPVPSRTIPRPGHVDLAAAIKYNYDDLRPGLERASARETAARVAIGAVCKQFLSHLEIKIGGYVRSIGSVETDLSNLSLEVRSANAEQNDVRCPDPYAAESIRKEISQATEEGETLGGVIEVFGLNLTTGLGSHVHWDRKLDSRLAQAVMSIPAIKGVEIGSAFENTRKSGTAVQDPILPRDNFISRNQNAAGGMEGGITNGQPIIIRAAMKPISTTRKPQQSVDLVNGKKHKMIYERSDVCPVPRAVVVVEAMAGLDATVYVPIVDFKFT